MTSHSVKVIAVTGGKGGVGKSNVSVNLAVSLAKLGKRVVIMDADLGLANIDVLLGISAGKNIKHVAAGECNIRDILVPGPGGIQIVPASSGTAALASLTKQEHSAIINSFNEISDEIDILIIDTAAGITDAVTSYVSAAQEALFVVTDEPTSITDAYALIKILNQTHKRQEFRIVANMVRTDQEGINLYKKLLNVTDRFLDISLRYVGALPMDDALKKAVQRQRAVVEAYPRAKVSLAFEKLAIQVNQWPVQKQATGHLEFFLESLICA